MLITQGALSLQRMTKNKEKQRKARAQSHSKAHTKAKAFTKYYASTNNRYNEPQIQTTFINDMPVVPNAALGNNQNIKDNISKMLESTYEISNKKKVEHDIKKETEQIIEKSQIEKESSKIIKNQSQKLQKEQVPDKARKTNIQIRDKKNNKACCIIY